MDSNKKTPSHVVVQFKIMGFLALIAFFLAFVKTVVIDNTSLL